LKKTPKKAKKTSISALEVTLKRPGASEGALGADKSAESAHADARGHLTYGLGR